MNYYELLDIARDADKETVKRAYFAAVKKHSPDSDPEGFKSVRNAYEILSDEKKRMEYDAYFAVSGGVQNEILAARELMRQNKYKQAVENLTALSEKNPGAAEIKRLLAEALWLIKKTVTADSICKELLEKDPADAETLLLRGNISVSRGHTNKAREYFEAAVACDPNNPKVWVEYARYARDYRDWQTDSVCEKAMNINPDMFRDEYLIYLYPVCDRSNSIFHMLSETAQMTDFETLCFEKFTEFFLADRNPSEIIYSSALNSITYIWKRKGFVPLAEKILPALESCSHRKESKEDLFKRIYGAIAEAKLKADKRIHDSLAELTAHLFENCGCSDCNDKKLEIECYIVVNLIESRASLKVLRNNYPDYFKLNQAFYLDVLNEKKTEFIVNKYYGIYKRLNASKARDDDYDDDDEEDYDDEGDYDFFTEDFNDLELEPQKPFVRETPKVGRNEPCPCGSGKKYKKCCG